jgi:hypothetical protein
MIWFLRIAAIVVLLSILAVTGWASSVVARWKMPREVATHPWFIATLFDTCFAIMMLGNIAMAIYALREIFRVVADARIEDVLLRRK